MLMYISSSVRLIRMLVNQSKTFPITCRGMHKKVKLYVQKRQASRWLLAHSPPLCHTQG